MASDQLRKKWGTIFMGEREATPQQLDAMQESLLRERAQHQQQEDYLARVRARAEERARAILGAAYAERQKVLEEAGVEAQARVEQFPRAAKELKAQAQAELAEAQAEPGPAQMPTGRSRVSPSLSGPGRPPGQGCSARPETTQKDRRRASAQRGLCIRHIPASVLPLPAGRGAGRPR